MSESPSIRTIVKRLIYFFPIQLLLVNLKKNFQLVIFWLLLFLATTELIGVKYGIPFLFLEPEYMGAVSFWSFGLVGFSLGGFVIAFNISSYIMNGYRFPFLATLERPFLKYCINNSTIPLIYIFAYLMESFHFLSENESFSTMEIISQLAGFIVGYFIFTFLSMRYFMSTNKNFLKIFGKEATRLFSSDNKKKEPISSPTHKKGRRWFQRIQKNKWRVETYISSSFRLRLARNVAHYNREMLAKVFRQNNINASVFEIIVLISVFSLGLFREIDVFEIPAGATLILIFTMMLMITSAIRSWLGGWTVLLLLAIILTVNLFSKQNIIYFESRAYGLNYETEKAPYPDFINNNALEQKQLEQKDLKSTKKILTNWKKKTDKEKPIAVFVNASGGGLRASLWTFHALQYLDSLTNGALNQQMVLISGSSGGMIGASFIESYCYKKPMEML